MPIQQIFANADAVNTGVQPSFAPLQKPGLTIVEL
jgi:hypothetical protein